MTADGSAKHWNWASRKLPFAIGSFRARTGHPSVPSACSKADINKDERVTMNYIFHHSPEQPSCTNQR